MASTASRLTPHAPSAAQSWSSHSANSLTASRSTPQPLFIGRSSTLKGGVSRRRNAARSLLQSSARWESMGLKHGAPFFEDICQGCRRQGLGRAEKRRGLRRGPVAEAVRGQEGEQAGASGRGSSNGASGVKVADVPPLLETQADSPQNGGPSQNGVKFSGGEGDGLHGSATNGSAKIGSATNGSATNGRGLNGATVNGAKQPLNGRAKQPTNGKPAATVESKTQAPERLQTPQFGNGVLALPQRLWRRTLRSLSSLELAIGTLLTVAALSALGTVVEQNKSYQFYINNYPEENPSFGFLSWKVLLDLELDHIYTSWWFLSLLAFLAACLMACTSTRQLPMAKVARRWRFLKSKAQFRDMDVIEELPRAKAADLVPMLSTKGYEVFMKGPSVYAFRGLAGKLGPIGVHIGLILTMAGCAYSATAGFEGSSMTPQGQEFFIGDVLKPVGVLSRMPAAEQYRVHVNNFSIDYMPNGNVNQYYSDLSIVDLNDNEVYHKMIKVNDPLRYGGVTMYQTDWNLASLQARVDGGAPFRLPMAILDDGVGKTGKLFGTFLRTGPAEEPRGVSLVARDFLSVAIYGPDGNFVGVRRPGSNKPITVDGKDIVIEELIGATGMRLKYDPGVPFVYAGFGTLIVTVIVSQVSHDQLWALEEGGALIVGARSTKNKQSIPGDLDFLFDALPEYLPSEEEGQSMEQTASGRNGKKASVAR